MSDTVSTEISVLVVDDSRDTVESTAELLLLDGFQVFTALSGPECLRIAAAEEPDVILLDIKMPGMDGFEVARRIGSERTKKPPVLIAVTVCCTDQEQAAIMASGFHLHLVKPVDPALLIGMLRRIRSGPDQISSQKTK